MKSRDFHVDVRAQTRLLESYGNMHHLLEKIET